MKLQELQCLRVVARRDRDVVFPLLEKRDERSEEQHLRGVRDVDPDPHALTLPTTPTISSAYMDTRQLAAFCAVVERRSFSQAAERLGVTQPAVSLQVRSLEKRLDTQLLDRSGRRVEPTEAGWRLYRGAQRLLALEEQVVSAVAATVEGELT